MGKNSYAYILCALFCLAHAICATAHNPQIFEKKGKYGLVDQSTGKELIKAKYDTILPFNGRDFAIVMKKGKYGLVTNKGKEYLGCKYQKILFPELSTTNGKTYFWTSKDGKTFFRESNADIYTQPLYGVFYGPDNNWYGMTAERKWRKFVKNEATAANFKGDSPIIEKLPGDYLLFNNELYSPAPDRRKIYDEVSDPDTITIADTPFLKANLGGGTLLIDRKSSTHWQKSSPGLNGVYGAKGKPYNLLRACLTRNVNDRVAYRGVIFAVNRGSVAVAT